jgi:conjugative relaxase-like TrwC/TraI family protein
MGEEENQSKFMMSISKAIHGGGLGQYLGFEDYLAAQSSSEWMGEGAKRLNLSGKVDGKVLQNLLLGFSPNKEFSLVQNAGDPTRQSCWDSVYSSPKSVSVLWALAPREPQVKMEKAAFDAVRSLVNYVIEPELGFSRRGHSGKCFEPADLVFAAFRHGTSRAQDPQLHVHLTIVNAGFRHSDESWGTILSRPFFDNKMALGALFRMELATRLEKEVGLQIERVGDSFNVVGVPEGLCNHFSQRSKAIRAALAAKGLDSAEAAAVAALDTREPKHNIPSGDLFAAWRKRAVEFGWGPDEALKLFGEVNPTRPGSQLAAHVPEGDLRPKVRSLRTGAEKSVGDVEPPSFRASKQKLTAWESLEGDERPGDELLRLPAAELVDRLGLKETGVEFSLTGDKLSERLKEFQLTAEGRGLSNRDITVLGKAYELKSKLSSFTEPDPKAFSREREKRDELTFKWFGIVEDRSNKHLFGPQSPFEKLEALLSPHLPLRSVEPLETLTTPSRASHSRLMNQTLAEVFSIFSMRQILPGRDFIQKVAETAVDRGFLIRDVCEAVRHHWPETLLGLTVQQKRLFPYAPFWSPFKDWTLPHLAFPRHYSPPRAIVVAAKEIPGFRIEQLRVKPFHKAPKWSPVKDISLRALRVRPTIHEQLGAELKKTVGALAPLSEKIAREISKRRDAEVAEKPHTVSPKVGGL